MQITFQNNSQQTVKWYTSITTLLKKAYQDVKISITQSFICSSQSKRRMGAN